MKSVGIFLSMIVVPLAACNSPLLEHANAQEAGGRSRSDASSQNSRCPLNFPQHGICAELTWDQTPNEQNPSTFTLRFWASGEATSNGPYSAPNDKVFVKLWMPSMGHGSAPVTLAQEMDAGNQVIPGIYSGSNVYFIMTGAWQVKVQLKQGSTVTEEANLDVQI